MASYPDATTTGVPAGVTLTPSGGMTITKAGTVINAADIKGSIDIEANNVTIENSRITSSGFSVIHVGVGVTGTVVKDSEINGLSSGGIGIFSQGNGTFVGNNIHNTADGLSIGGGTTSAVVQDNYIHAMTGTSSSHFDAIQIEGDASNIKIEHNSIINENGQTSAVMICPDFGPTTNVTVDNNILSGGGFTIYAARTTSQDAVSNISITNNHMGSGQYGITDFANTSPVYTGNVNDGAALAASLQTTGPRTTTASGTTSDSGTTTSGSGTTTSGSGTSTSGSGTTTSGSGTTTSGSGTTTTTDHSSSGVTTQKYSWGTAMHGTSGNDTLVDLPGKVAMTGEAGNDHFAFNSVANMGSTPWDRDIIRDFTSGTDKIDLSGIDANSKVSGNQSFSFLSGDNQSFTHTAGQIAWRTDAAHNQTIIQGDTNGDGTHDFEIQLTGIHPLHASDFIF